MLYMNGPVTFIKKSSLKGGILIWIVAENPVSMFILNSPLNERFQ